jgi:tetraacyldisaccharide 4'-kinase
MAIGLSPLGSLYGAAMQARRALYRAGRLRVFELGVPVISVGNLTTGGTGKTPLVQWIASELARAGRRVCILTRGYGRQSGTRVIVSDGSEILSDANLAGDEPLLLAEQLQGSAAVICDADRVSAARWAIENLHSEVFLLDDGFQHLRVARNLNILTVDATNPWGNGKVLPAGILREPLAEIDRADCVVITRADSVTSTVELRRELSAHHPGCPIFSARMVQADLRPGSGSRLTLQESRKAPAAAFCAIGNPESFFSLLRRAGYQLVHTRAFRDHQYYSQRDIEEITREAVAGGAQFLITTAKDEVKLRALRFDLPFYALDIAIEIDKEEQFRAMITAAADGHA